MRTISVPIYTFDELSDEAKEKAINSFREDPFGFEFEADSIIEFWKERLDIIGFEEAEIAYSGFYHQGEGASFTADVNIEKVISSMTLCSIVDKKDAVLYNKMLHMQDINILEMVFIVYRTSPHYSHELTISVDSDSEFYLNECSEAYSFFNTVFEDLLSEIEEYVRSLCQSIFFDLRNSYERINSDDYITQSIRDNEFEFYKDGSLY